MSVPLVWDVLGKERFGACLFLLALSRWVGLIDIGFLDGSQRQMTLAFDAGDDAKGFSAWKTYRATVAFHALLGGFLFLLLSRFIHVPDVGKGTDLTGLFFAAGAVFAAQYLFQGASTFFNARREFPRLAISNGSQSLLSGVLALLLTLQFRVPEAYLYGFAIGNFSVAFFNYLTITLQGRGVPAVRFDKTSFRESLNFGLRLYPTRFATVVSATFDRIIVTNAMGSGDLAHYGSAARLPESAYDAFPLNQILVPDLTKASASGDAAFAESVEKNSRIALMVGCGLIFVPCALAQPVLVLWLGDKFVPGMAWVMVAIGLYRALEMFYTCLAGAMIAHGSPQRVLPFTVYNAVATLALTWPAAVWQGIIGVAGLRAAIHMGQFYPLMAFTRRWIVPSVDLRAWVLRSLGVFGLACLVAVGCIALWSPLRPVPWVALLVAPVAMASFFFLVDRLGFAEIPERLKKRLASAFGR